MKYALLLLALFAVPAFGATVDVAKATADRATAVKAASDDRGVALEKCKKEATADKKKVCRTEAQAAYRKSVATADEAKALATADVKAVKEDVKPVPAAK
jgi:hypothetical protein